MSTLENLIVYLDYLLVLTEDSCKECQKELEVVLVKLFHGLLGQCRRGIFCIDKMMSLGKMLTHNAVNSLSQKIQIILSLKIT